MPCGLWEVFLAFPGSTLYRKTPWRTNQYTRGYTYVSAIGSGADKLHLCRAYFHPHRCGKGTNIFLFTIENFYLFLYLLLGGISPLVPYTPFSWLCETAEKGYRVRGLCRELTNFEPKIQPIMALTSIHFEPCKVNFSQAHNLREVDLSYVNKELSHLNESTYSKFANSDPSIKDLALREQQCRALYQEKVGQKAQSKTVFLREGVVVIDKSTSGKDMTNLMLKIAKYTGWTPLQVHIHRDEGHYEGTEFVQNLHAHVIFDCQDKSSGKVIRVDKEQLSTIQDITAECLKMERGIKSNKKHIEATQYRAMKVQEEITLKEIEKKSLSDEIEHLSSKIDDLAYKNAQYILQLLRNFESKLKEFMPKKSDKDNIRENIAKIVALYQQKYANKYPLTSREIGRASCRERV